MGRNQSCNLLICRPVPWPFGYVASHTKSKKAKFLAAAKWSYQPSEAPVVHGHHSDLRASVHLKRASTPQVHTHTQHTHTCTLSQKGAHRQTDKCTHIHTLTIISSLLFTTASTANQNSELLTVTDPDKWGWGQILPTVWYLSRRQCCELEN